MENMGCGIPELENRVKKPSYALNFFLEFLMKIKFWRYVTRKVYLYLTRLKFPSYTIGEFKFH